MGDSAAGVADRGSGSADDHGRVQDPDATHHHPKPLVEALLVGCWSAAELPAATAKAGSSTAVCSGYHSEVASHRLEAAGSRACHSAKATFPAGCRGLAGPLGYRFQVRLPDWPDSNQERVPHSVPRDLRLAPIPLSGLVRPKGRALPVRMMQALACSPETLLQACWAPNAADAAVVPEPLPLVSLQVLRVQQVQAVRVLQVSPW